MVAEILLNQILLYIVVQSYIIQSIVKDAIFIQDDMKPGNGVYFKQNNLETDTWHYFEI